MMRTDEKKTNTLLASAPKRSMKVEAWGKGATYNTQNDKGLHSLGLQITEMKKINTMKYGDLATYNCFMHKLSLAKKN